VKKNERRKHNKVKKQKLERGKQVQKYLIALRNFNIVSVFITKNEEENLPRLFKSLDGFADRIVIVDTGSTDNTIEVAQKLGAKVYTMTWPDSFSEARNKAIELANTTKATWIAMFDADEVLENGKELRTKLQCTNSTIGVVGLYHRTKYGHKFPRNCIWRPGKAKWLYRFHEHLIPYEKNIQVIIDHNIHHPDDVGKNHDNDKILEMMRLDVIENPNHHTRKYYYGRQLFYRKDIICLDVLKEVYDNSTWPAEAAQAVVFAGNFFEEQIKNIEQNPNELQKDKLISEAKQIAANFYRMSIAKYPRLRGSYFGIIRTTTDDYEKLIAAATAIKINESTFFDDPPGYYEPHNNGMLIGLINKLQHNIQQRQTKGEAPLVGYAETIS
jgi:glycosyltransferase involved in cell wall biosynthesis